MSLMQKKVLNSEKSVNFGFINFVFPFRAHGMKREPNARVGVCVSVFIYIKSRPPSSPYI